MSKANLYAAMLAAQQEFGPVLKSNTADVLTKTGGKFQYTYADLESVLDCVQPVLAKHGLLLYQQIQDDGQHRSLLATTLAHVESGEDISSTAPIICKDPSDPQSLGSGITYLRRYSLLALFGIAPEDDDGAAGKNPPSHNRRAQQHDTVSQDERPRTQFRTQPSSPPRQETGELATPKQRGMLLGKTKEFGYTEMDPDGQVHADQTFLSQWLYETYGYDWPSLTKRQASEVLDGWLKGDVHPERIPI